MTDNYCPEKHAGTPAHTCLCYHQPHHHGGHECRCGHYWGIDWNTMTYAEQWRFLGLPEMPISVQLNATFTPVRDAFLGIGDTISVTMDDLRVAILGLIQTDSEFATGQFDEEES